jgi:hypothetical protein
MVEGRLVISSGCIESFTFMHGGLVFQTYLLDYWLGHLKNYIFKGTPSEKKNSKDNMPAFASLKICLHFFS